jgi:7,8-dihydroneopterin aldolase/epimerase/oxygenase
MDTIYIEQLCIDTFVGTNAWEQEERQEISVDLFLQADISRAAASDSLYDAVDYQEVARQVTQVVSKGRFQLLETVAKTIADCLEVYPHICAAEIRVAKPHALENAAEVGVIHNAVFVRDFIEEEITTQGQAHE